MLLSCSWPKRREVAGQGLHDFIKEVWVPRGHLHLKSPSVILDDGSLRDNDRILVREDDIVKPNLPARVHWVLEALAPHFVKKMRPAECVPIRENLQSVSCGLGVLVEPDYYGGIVLPPVVL